MIWSALAYLNQAATDGGSLGVIGPLAAETSAGPVPAASLQANPLRAQPLGNQAVAAIDASETSALTGGTDTQIEIGAGN